jgi:hypothetical protein
VNEDCELLGTSRIKLSQRRKIARQLPFTLNETTEDKMITEYLNVKETMRKQSEGKTRDEARCKLN